MRKVWRRYIKKKKVTRLVVIAVVLVLIFAYMQITLYNRHKVVTYKVKVSSIETAESINSEYIVNGSLVVHNNNVHAVAMEYGAKIEEVYVESGQSVKEGDFLFKVKKISDNSVVTIKSDYSGIASYTNEIYPGSIVSQYATVLTVYQLTGTDDFYIQAQVSASEYQNISDINDIKVTFAGVISDIKLEGVLEDKLPQVLKQNNTQYYNICIKVNDSESQLKDYELLKGMNVKVSISSAVNLENLSNSGNDSYYTVPFNAIVARGDKNVVFTYERNGEDHMAKMVTVDVLSSNGETAVVKPTSTGLHNNSGVITEGNYKLSGNEKVSIENGI